jgi:hypothetical protein
MSSPALCCTSRIRWAACATCCRANTAWVLVPFAAGVEANVDNEALACATGFLCASISAARSQLRTPGLSSPTEPASGHKPDQHATEDEHDDHDQDELPDTREETSGLQFGGEEAGLGRSEDHGYRW